MRYLAEKGSFEHGAYNPYVNLLFHYGDPLSDERKPYDFFNADFYRRSIYFDHDNVSMKTFELRAGLTYEF